MPVLFWIPTLCPLPIRGEVSRSVGNDSGDLQMESMVKEGNYFNKSRHKQPYDLCKVAISNALTWSNTFGSCDILFEHD